MEDKKLKELLGNNNIMDETSVEEELRKLSESFQDADTIVKETVDTYVEPIVEYKQPEVVAPVVEPFVNEETVVQVDVQQTPKPVQQSVTPPLEGEKKVVRRVVKVKKEKKKKDWFKGFLFVLVCISLGMNGYLFYNYEYATNDGVAVSSQVVNYDINTNLTDMIEETSKSVVAIAVYSNGQMAGSGSGVVYAYQNGMVYMITNHHVIDGASEIQVIFHDKESVTATLIGSDQYSDIAVLQAQVDFVPTVIDLGDSDLLKAGETVLAIGSPLGIEYAGSVTQGVVSATDRTVSVDLSGNGQDDWDMNVIQTDAAINPGNSGGAFVNALGELVGITSMKFSDTSVEGMGFSLPINDVMIVVEEIREHGKVSRPVLGISGVSLSSFSFFELSYYRIDTDLTDGIYVGSVAEGSGAYYAGLEVGDIITSMNGAAITTYKSFVTELYNYSPGDTIALGINRGGEDSVITVMLGG